MLELSNQPVSIFRNITQIIWLCIVTTFKLMPLLILITVLNIYLLADDSLLFSIKPFYLTLMPYLHSITALFLVFLSLLTLYLMDKIAHKQKVIYKESIKLLSYKIPRTLFAILLVAFIELIPCVIFFVALPFFSLHFLTSTLKVILITLSVIIGIIILLKIMISLMLTLPLVILDNIKVINAFKKSVELIRGYWWRTFFIFFISMALLLPLSILTFIPIADCEGYHACGWINIILSTTGITLINFFIIAFYVVIHHELRLRGKTTE